MDLSESIKTYSVSFYKIPINSKIWLGWYQKALCFFALYKENSLSVHIPGSKNSFFSLSFLPISVHAIS